MQQMWFSLMTYQYAISAGMLAVCSITDLRRRRINIQMLVLYGILVLLGHLSVKEMDLMILVFGMIPGIVSILLSLISKEELGLGDSILILLLGLSVGIDNCLELLLISFIGAGLVGLCLLLLHKAGRRTELPFAPFLFLAVMIRIISVR